MSALHWIEHFTDEQTELHVGELIAPLIAVFVLWPLSAFPLLGAPLKLGAGALIYGTMMSLWLLMGRLERTAKLKRVMGVLIASYIIAFTVAHLWDQLIGSD